IDWLWPGYLPLGGMAILDGDPGVGKSLVTLDLAARLTTGRPWPDGKPSPGPASVVLLCDEDFDNILLARLNSAGAERCRITHWSRSDGASLPRLPKDMDRIEEAVKRTQAKLLIIDPIMAFLDRSVMTSSDADVRRVLGPLACLADKHRCVVLLVRHLNKK